MLFIEEVTYESAVIVDNQPCLLFNFEVQSVGAFYNAEGECVAGDPDNIEKTYCASAQRALFFFPTPKYVSSFSRLACFVLRCSPLPAWMSTWD